MKNYVWLIDSSVSCINAIIAGNLACIEVNSISTLKKGDQILGFINNPTNKITLLFTVDQDQIGQKVTVKKEYDVSAGVPLTEFPSKVSSSINSALIAGEDIIEIDANDFDSINKQLRLAFSSTIKPSFDPLMLFKKSTATKLKFPRNYIIYGAPGTGKSDWCEKNRGSFNSNYERVTFYDRYSYANFVGSYKPSTVGNNIIYSYIPGPFIRMLVRALKNKTENHLLIIEEINRANAASVFGDVFQLLDRDNDGISQYAITTSYDLRKYLAKEFYGNAYVENDEVQLQAFSSIVIPDNLYIWATMNSMDQGVSALDTAFKRRWEFKYIGINDSEALKKLSSENYMVPMLKDPKRSYFVKWDDLRQGLNDKLLALPGRISEDRLLGAFFISPHAFESVMNNPMDVSNSEAFIGLIESKLIMYLFDDVVRNRPKDIFVGVKRKLILSEIFEDFEELGETIFGLSLTHYSYDTSTKSFK